MKEKSRPPRLWLVHWDRMEAEQLAEPLRLAGWLVSLTYSETSFRPKGLEADPPRVVVISLRRLPCHGRLVADVISQTDWGRQVPLVFVDGIPKEVERTQRLHPNAQYIHYPSLLSAVERFQQLSAQTQGSGAQRVTRNVEGEGHHVSASAGHVCGFEVEEQIDVR